MTREIEALIAAAEPGQPRSLGGLVDRLAAADLLAGAAPSAARRPVVDVRGVAFDSRAVRPGNLFVAVPGEHVDGHAFVGPAVAAGAAAALVEHVVVGVEIPQVVVRGGRRALAAAAAWWYGEPSRDLGVVGITGTDGKTTTSFLAVGALEAAGISTGLSGTVDTKIGATREPNDVHATTPEAPTLQAMLRAMVDAGNRAAVIETTSHGLALDRVAEVAYDAAILTNLSHEHLELHKSFEAYLAAKRSLFERLVVSRDNPPKAGLGWPKTAIVNADDASVARFVAAAATAGARLLTYGAEPSADVRLLATNEDERRLRVRYAAPSGAGELALRLAGRFNAHNALAVVALGEALGLDPADVRTGLESVTAVPGRMERIDAGQPFAVIVDYAHTPAALEAVLELLGPLAAARGGGLIAVFGSAGERDTAKRPMMGRVAGQRCRVVVLADEDPRGEDRQSILEEIAAGAEAAGRRRGHDLLLIPDRGDAIAAAFERARPGDVVLLAGKGHETSIIGPDGPVPWDERDAARDALASLGYDAPPGAVQVDTRRT
jgi:UDP-N-acetylmuramoyl-L-alanyl-D-glutamate--2,6-diaminopimelate ligase